MCIYLGDNIPIVQRFRRRVSPVFPAIAVNWFTTYYVKIRDFPYPGKQKTKRRLSAPFWSWLARSINSVR